MSTSAILNACTSWTASPTTTKSRWIPMMRSTYLSQYHRGYTATPLCLSVWKMPRLVISMVWAWFSMTICARSWSVIQMTLLSKFITKKIIPKTWSWCLILCSLINWTKDEPSQVNLGVSSSKFFGFMVTSRGILDKVCVTYQMQPSKNLKVLRRLQKSQHLHWRFSANLSVKCQFLSRLI